MMIHPHADSIAAKVKMVMTPELVHQHLMKMLREEVGDATFDLLDTSQFEVTIQTLAGGTMVFGIGYHEPGQDD